MRLVLDTNVIISALMFGGRPEKLMLSVLGGPHQLVLSPYIIFETTRILETRFNVSTKNLINLQSILNESDIVYFEPFLDIVSDGPDNRIIETAVKGEAVYLVTGDKLLLKLGAYKSIKIITIAECLKLI
ncbi:MAG: putative toxin-antitoxin system toxin component, PIN family [Candidatus Saccharibacteria bacterium]